MKQLIMSTLKRVGYRFVPDPLDSFFSVLKRMEFAPKHIVDVGANRGSWTRQAIKFFPDARYTLIEPQDHLKKHIEDLLAHGYQICWINAAVSDTSGTYAFTISHRDDSSNLRLTPEQAQARGYKQIDIDVRTLNEIVSSSSASPPDMVKIDAEGFDLKVLAGASDLIGQTEIFLLEAAVCARGIENTISRVIQSMDDIGYHLIDITDLNRAPRDGLLWLCELAFLRSDSKLLDKVTSYE